MKREEFHGIVAAIALTVVEKGPEAGARALLEEIAHRDDAVELRDLLVEVGAFSMMTVAAWSLSRDRVRPMTRGAGH